MEKREIILELQKKISNENIDAYIITKFDAHQSEYSSEYWNEVKFVSGFSGSAGTVVITSKEAGLWTDGRYYLQAEDQLKGSGIKLHKAADIGVKNFDEYLANILKDGGTIGFDGRTMSMLQVSKIKKLLKDINVKFKADKDLVDEIWNDRPEQRERPVYIHDLKYCGKDRNTKLKELRAKMAEERVNVCVISSLDDIAWLYNLRGSDIEGLTVFTAFSIIDESSVTLFVADSKIESIKEELKKDGILIQNYDKVYEYIEMIDNTKIISINPNTVNYSLYTKLENKKLQERSIDITSELKAVKNTVELENFERTSIRDGVAMVRFIKWLKESVGTKQITECDIVDRLIELRSQGENYISPSFDTISGYMENGAIIHNHADRMHCKTLKPEGLVLVDSGGNYLDGTTDITRTIALGPVTNEMKYDFTLVLKSHIGLAQAVFPYGVTGLSLDTFARMPMWANLLDYKHGTGHGIGFCLNVHEGPQNISQRVENHTIIEAGMLTTNEPGLYRPGKYGIRTENIVIAVELQENDFGKFLCFKTASYCPIDLAAISEDMLTTQEKEWLNAYHGEVYEKLSPFLSEAETLWLKEQTKAI